MRWRVRLSPMTTKPARVTMFMPKRMSWVSIRLATIVSAPCQREPNPEIGRYRDLSRKSRPLISPFPSSVNCRRRSFRSLPIPNAAQPRAGEPIVRCKTVRVVHSSNHGKIRKGPSCPIASITGNWRPDFAT
jgi:hypothetical protein